MDCDKMMRTDSFINAKSLSDSVEQVNFELEFGEFVLESHIHNQWHRALYLQESQK